MHYNQQPDTYRDDRMPGERGFPRGPLAHIRDAPPRDGGDPIPIAIGFCPRCGANARRTTQVRGLFDCPKCVGLPWYDDRVGEQSRSFEDYFAPDDRDGGCGATEAGP